MFDFSLKCDERPPKNGWYSGGYFCRCRNCAGEFIGAKGAWTCSDCAYDFDEQLQYEQLWRDYGWPYMAEYVTRKIFKNKTKQKD